MTWNFTAFRAVMKADWHVALWWKVWWMNAPLPQTQLLHPPPPPAPFAGYQTFTSFTADENSHYAYHCAPKTWCLYRESHCVSWKQWHSPYLWISTSQTVKFPSVEPQSNILWDKILVLWTGAKGPLKFNKEFSHSYVHPLPFHLYFLSYLYFLPSFPITTVN
jgi:hypothetical protein